MMIVSPSVFAPTLCAEAECAEADFADFRDLVDFPAIPIQPYAIAVKLSSSLSDQQVYQIFVQLRNDPAYFCALQDVLPENGELSPCEDCKPVMRTPIVHIWLRIRTSRSSPATILICGKSKCRIMYKIRIRPDIGRNIGAASWKP